MINALLATVVISFSGGCAEDNPCWNWTYMGDHRRGIQGLIVSPCRFQRLILSGKINYRRSDIMKGDDLAMRINCHRKIYNAQ